LLLISLAKHIAEAFMSKVFISYRRADGATFSERIHDRLTAKFGRSNVFKGVDDIPPGMKFVDYLVDSLRHCTVALVVIGPHWLDAHGAQGDRQLDDPTDFVRLEVETALNLGLVIIPLLVDGATIPASADLPESLRPLVMYDAPVVREAPDFGHDMERVIADVELAFASRPDAGELARPATSSPPIPPIAQGPQRAAPNIPSGPLPTTDSGAPLRGVGSALAPAEAASWQAESQKGVASPKPATAALLMGKQAESGRTPRIWRQLMARLAVILVVMSFALLLNGCLFNTGKATNTGNTTTPIVNAPASTATATASATPVPANAYVAHLPGPCDTGAATWRKDSQGGGAVTSSCGADGAYISLDYRSGNYSNISFQYTLAGGLGPIPSSYSLSVHAASLSGIACVGFILGGSSADLCSNGNWDINGVAHGTVTPSNAFTVSAMCKPGEIDLSVNGAIVNSHHQSNVTCTHQVSFSVTDDFKQRVPEVISGILSDFVYVPLS
jgi:hypothetical protein